MTVRRLSPFPLTSADAALVIDDTFDAWADNGWEEQDNGGDFSGAWGPNGAFAAALLFGAWGDEGPAERDSFLVKTYTVDEDSNPLPPNTLVLVRVAMTWTLGVGCPGGPGPTFVDFFGAEANGVRGALPGPLFFEPVLREILILTRTNGAGELEVKVGAEGMSGSFDIASGFISVKVSRLAAELADIYYDAGVLYIDGNAFSITRGGHAFDPGEVWEDYDFPGKRAPVEGLDELVSCRPVIRTRCMLTGEYQITVYRPGGSWGDHGSIEDARTFTPANLGVALATSAYLHNVIVVWPRTRGDYIAVHFPVAKNLKYGMHSQDKDEGEIDVELEARIPTGEPLNTVPYLIHTYPADIEAVG